MRVFIFYGMQVYNGRVYNRQRLTQSQYADVDALAPCAVGGILNPQTIPNIKAKIICGAANNQLHGMPKLVIHHSRYVC